MRTSVLQTSATRFVSAAPPAVERSDPVAVVRAVLDQPDEELDYARAKIAFDRLIDPTIDEASVLAELDRLSESARKLAGAAPNDSTRLNAVRRTIYESGPWNGWRPFAYDMSDPLGRRMRNKLLHNYLATRLGQCVSMPVLYIVLAERLGLNVALASAPEHVFVRYSDANGRSINLETTSGAHPTRDDWYRENFPISDRAVETGLFLRSLTRREAVALMATTVMEHAFDQRRFEEVIALCKLIISHSQSDAQTMVVQATACGHMGDRLRRQHPNPWTAPPIVRAQLLSCIERNIGLIAAAERLGWVPFG